jgi:hypothetical protein
VSAPSALAASLAGAPIDVGEVRTDTPRELADLVMRCINKERQLRPQKMDEVLIALDHVGWPISPK